MREYTYNSGTIHVTDETPTLTPMTFHSNGTVWERESLEYFYNLVKQKDGPVTIVDIGAQTGLYSLYAKFLPHIQIHAFEPNPETYQQLTKNLELNSISNVELRNCGIGSHNDKLVLKIPYNPEEKGLCCLTTSTPLRFSSYYEHQTDIVTLDSLFYEKNIPVHFIKCDTEGWEPNVLLGAKKTIERWKPELFLEINDINLKQCNSSEEVMFNLLDELNYDIVSIIDRENYHCRAK